MTQHIIIIYINSLSGLPTGPSFNNYLGCYKYINSGRGSFLIKVALIQAWRIVVLKFGLIEGPIKGEAEGRIEGQTEGG